MMRNKTIEILIVDDDEGDAFMAQEALGETKIANNIHIARDGLEAIDFMEKNGDYKKCPTPDLVLLDLNMPRMNGHEVLAWIRAHEKYKIIPVIILTTSSSDKDVLASYQKFANCFITKPVDLKHFNKVIKYIDEFWTNIARLPQKV